VACRRGGWTCDDTGWWWWWWWGRRVGGLARATLDRWGGCGGARRHLVSALTGRPGASNSFLSFLPESALFYCVSARTYVRLVPVGVSLVCCD